MKPILLKINGFGSFGKHEELDLSKYKGLWLISGDTGSGKTTIFDAITYALYGMTSDNSARGVKNIRSDYADENTDTYVELEFEHEGKNYIIRRNPEYQKIKVLKNGKIKETKNSAAVELKTKEGKILASKVKEASSWIEDNLGINYDQFCKLVLIAQGDFMSIIRSSTDEKEKMFRTLFHTERFEDLSKKIDEKRKEYKDKYDVSLGELIGISQNFDYSEESKNDDRYNISNPDNNLVTLQEEQINKENNKYHKELKEKEKISLELKIANENYEKAYRLHEKFLSLEKAINEVNLDETKKQEYEELEKLLKKHKKALDLKQDIHLKEEASRNNKERQINYEKAKISFNNAKEELENINKQYETISIKKEELSNLNIEIKDKNKLIEKYNSYEKAINNQKKLEKEIINLENNSKIKEDELIKKNDELINERNKINSLNDLIRKENEISNSLNSLYESKKAYDELKDLEDTYLKEYKEKEKLNKDYLIKKDDYSKAVLIYSNALDSYINQQAYKMAKDLVEGNRCPVCGSIHHPLKATLSSEKEVKKEDLDLKEKDKNEKEKSLELSRNNLNKEESVLNNIETLKNNKLIEIQNKNIDDYEVLINKIDKNNKLLDEIKKQILDAENSKNKIKIIEKEIEDIKEEIKVFNENCTSKKIELSRLKGSNEELIIELKGKDKKDIIKELDKLNDDYSVLEKNINFIEKEKSDKDINYSSNESNLKAAKKEYEDSKDVLNLKVKILNEKIVNSIFVDEEECMRYMPKSQDVVLKEKEEITKYLNESKIHLENRDRLKEELKGLEDLDIGPLKEKCEELDKKIKEIEGNLGAYKQRINSLNKAHENLKEQLIKTEALRKNMQTYSDLYSAISGKNDAIKLSLERYVQRYHYQRVIDRANIRLAKMTNNMFALSLSELGSGIGQQGLDLDVLDFQTGVSRRASTLSGGESFKAALSLALGMADIISDSTNIHIDAMFIDEGFGTLDDNSLSQALDVLNNISESDHRMVGVISHRVEMKERINQKIIVKKNEKGSFIIED